MHPPVHLGPPTYLPYPANLDTRPYGFRQQASHTVTPRAMERSLPTSSAADEPHEAFAWAREGHVPTGAYRARGVLPQASLTTEESRVDHERPRENRASAVTHRAMDVIPEASLAAGEYHAPAARSLEPEQATVAHRPVEATAQASPAARVQPFTPVNPPKHAGQESSAAPHGSSPEPENVRISPDRDEQMIRWLTDIG